MGEAERQVTGGCLCGSVTYAVTGTLGDLLQCHCENCRRLSGNFVAASRTATDDVKIEDPGGELRWHDLGYARYGFCRSCGSTLFYQAADSPDVTSIMVGGLNEAPSFDLGAVWFADEALPHNELPAGVPHHRGNG